MILFLRRFLNGIECLRWFYSLTYSSKEPRSQRLPLGDHFFARPGCTRENRRWPSGAAWEKKCHPAHRQQQTAGGRQIRPTAHNACSEYAAYNRHHAHTPRAPHAAPDWACPQPPTHLPTHFCGHMQAGVSPRPPPNQKPFQRKILP